MAKTTDVGGIAVDRLRSLIERIERLEEERRALGGDIKDIYDEAKSAGFDVKVMRRLVKDRRMDPAVLEEQETLLEVYRRALGEYASTPIGAAAMDRVAGGKRAAA